MRYDFKKVAEVCWFVGVAVVVFVAELIVQWDFEAVAADWQSYATALLGGAARAGVVAALAFFSRS